MGVLTFHRSEFQKVLATYLDYSVVTPHFRKRLLSYQQPSNDLMPIILEFKDGTTATCDVLIGTDGIHSVIRGQMYSDMAENIRKEDPIRAQALHDMKDPEWSGTYAYRGVFPKEDLEAIAPGHRAITTPMNVRRRIDC